MKSKHSFKARLLAATCGAAVIALAAGGVAMATTPSAVKPAAATASASASASLTGKGARTLRQDVIWLARHTVHATLNVHTAHDYKTLDIDRGRLTSDSSSSISIVRPDGPTVSAAITTSTRFPGLPESELAKGDRVVLVQTSGKAIVVWARLPKSSTGS